MYVSQNGLGLLLLSSAKRQIIRASYKRMASYADHLPSFVWLTGFDELERSKTAKHVSLQDLINLLLITSNGE